MFSRPAPKRTMKTLIVFLLSTTHTMLSARLPIEVFELRESNDNQLYVRHNNAQYRQADTSPLAKLLQPYKRNKDKIDQLTKNLIAKIKLLRKNKQENNYHEQDIYFINGDLLGGNSGEYFDGSGEFVDETRNEVFRPSAGQNVLYRILPEKEKIDDQPSHGILRTHVNDRTAPPPHRYYQEREEE